MGTSKEARSKYISIAASGALVILMLAIWVRPAQASFGLPASVWCAVADWVGWTPAACGDPAADEPPAAAEEEKAPSRPALTETVPGPPNPPPPVVENTYVSYPTTLILEEALTPFVDLSGLVTDQRLERQSDRIFSTISDLASTSANSLADALSLLAESFSTALLHVTGNASIGGDLDVFGETSLSTTTVAELAVSGDTRVGGTLAAGLLSVAGVASDDAISAPFYTATSMTVGSNFHDVMYLDPQAGAVGIGIANPTEKLSVAGNIHVTGGLGVGISNATAGTIMAGTSYGIGGVPILVQPSLTAPSIPYSVVGLGYGALGNFTPQNNTFEESSHITAVGYQSVSGGTSLDHITAIGSWSCAGLTDASGSFNTCLGIDTLRFWSSGTANTAVGEHALVGEFGYGGGTNNVAVGTSAGQYVNGSFNTALGQAALKGLSGSPLTGNGFNVALGNSAGSLMQGPASKNTAVGANALLNMTSQTLNTAVGFNAALYVAGNHNTAIGASSLSGVSGVPLTGSQNVAVGRNALLLAQGAANTNTAIGDSACSALTTGTANTCIGRNTGATNLTSGSSNILIGSGVDVSTLGQSSFLNIGNSIYGTLANGNIGVGTANPSAFKLQVAGHVGPNANTTYNLGSTALRWGCVWTSDGSTGTCASDERLKDHIEDLDFGDALAKVAGLRPRTFTFNDDPDQNLTLGLIAQEAEGLAPELVVTDPETGFKAVRYGALQWLVLVGLQELAAKVNVLADAVAGFATSFTSGRVTAENELCVDDLCITKEDLQELLDLRGSELRDPVTVAPPDPASPAEPAASDDDIPEPDDGSPDTATDLPTIDAPSVVPADEPVPVLVE